MDSDKINSNSYKSESDDMYSKQIIEKMSTSCPICLDEISVESITTNCFNKFCDKCLKYWLVSNNSCPICRNQEPINPLTIDKFNIDLLIGTIYNIKYSKVLKRHFYYKYYLCNYY